MDKEAEDKLQARCEARYRREEPDCLALSVASRWHRVGALWPASIRALLNCVRAANGLKLAITIAASFQVDLQARTLSPD